MNESYNLRVVCANCKRHTKHVLKERKEKLNRESVCVTYLLCTRCQNKSIVCVDNKKTKEYKEKINRLRRCIAWSADACIREKLLNKILLIKNQLEKESETLLSVYEKEN